jgi:hypothetical protein
MRLNNNNKKNYYEIIIKPEINLNSKDNGVIHLFIKCTKSSHC